MIPKIIWQTYSDSKLPDYVQNSVASWKDKNPGWEHKLYSEEDRVDFIKEHYPQYLVLYNNIVIPFIRADFWRYLALLKFGGVYADVDTICIESLENWLDDKAEFACVDSDTPEYGYALETFCFAVQPQSKFIQSIVDTMIERSQNNLGHGDYIMNTWHTGPYMVAEAVMKVEDKNGLKIYDDSFFDYVFHDNGSNRWSDNQEKRRLPHTHFWMPGRNVGFKTYYDGYGSGVAKEWQ